jgi:hypothetical protein
MQFVTGKNGERMLALSYNMTQHGAMIVNQDRPADH